MLLNMYRYFIIDILKLLYILIIIIIIYYIFFFQFFFDVFNDDQPIFFER